MSNIITLTKEERFEARKWGNARRDTNVNGQLIDLSHSGKPMKGCWRKNDVIGAGAEIAVARLLGEEFTGTVNSFHDVDVAGGWQVRCTDYSTGRLIIRPHKKDNLEHKYVLVVYEHNAVFNIKGWILGSDAIQDKFLFNPNGGTPAYFVPQHELADFNLTNLNKK
jgi:hypothetical protein|tara:strand:+ start:29289 stop:29786 length:498 start_codon:yes stop_codon:yes gene_type:complete